MTTITDTKRIYQQTASHLLRHRHGCWYIVDGATIINLGEMSITQAAMQAHDYRMTWKE
jgi:hypothetical protein